MRKYEVMFIVKPAEEEATNAVITKFENLILNNGGNIEKIDRWGKKRLAYEIKDFAEGFYCIFYFTAEPAVIAELDRVMKITDEILKHMIIKEDE
ncbi:30S ribosomal protein S6 [bioreactor metagenome]|uniref:30S ribosomal protein S6 n=1 Tax=bioreactor metagenome TaxID=1076179 RepID=A0A644SY70_9ZZZZ|nr:30S ribosomal protein S6 [Negativicutes bacterium]